MSTLDENEIFRRLKSLSQVEPTKEATDRAVQQVRVMLTNEQGESKGTGARIRKAAFRRVMAKFAAAAVVLIGLGYAAGRLSAPRPLDVDELRAALEPAIRQDLLEQVDKRWQSELAAGLVQVKGELQQQVGRDVAEFAAQTIAACRTLTDQRFAELIRLVEAAREQDRRRVAAALGYIEQNRREDKTRLGNGLVALAARANDSPSTERN